MQRATFDASECTLLTTLIRSGFAAGPCAAYNDWLMKNRPDDAAFFESVQKAISNPSLEPLPRPSGRDVWCNAIGSNLVDGMRKFELTEYADTIVNWVRPVVGIQTQPIDEDSIPIGGSKFGGHPDLPKELPWPTVSDGPLGFLGQINFNEIQNSLASEYFGLPEQGLLLLFAFQDDGIQPGTWDAGDDLVKTVFVTDIKIVC